MYRHRSSARQYTPPSMILLVRVLQALLGLFFIFSGITKGIDPMGTGLKVSEYLGLWGMNAELTTAIWLAVGLILLESLLGVSLLVGIWRRGTPVIGLLLMVPMTCLTLYIYIANPVADCGCFGDALKISNSATFWKNVVILLMMILLLRYKRSLYCLRSAKAQWIVAVIAALGLFSFTVYPLLYLPIVDFRPYKVGTPLSHFGGAPADDGTRYIYSRNGVERAFTVEELAEADSTWTYVRLEETIPEQPTEETADFILLDASGSEVGHQLAGSTARALLYVTYDLAEMTEAELQMGLELQRRASYPVTLVMPNTFDLAESHPHSDLIRQYDQVLFMDLKMIQTMIRSNPGLVVIDSGTIAVKYSYTDLRLKVPDGRFIKHIFSETNP